jgi:organic radical activating enzyme
MQESMNCYREFNPELIVEVTMVCDRVCPGCYAPNIISRKGHEITLPQRPELFLNAEVLRSRLIEITSLIGRPIKSLSFRGGEPSLHPRLPHLVEVSLEYTQQLFLETHGRWALPEATDTGLDVLGIIAALRNSSVFVKVSFDSMHSISSDELKRVIEVFDQNRVNWLVAVTESNDQEFLEQRGRCSWIPDSNIIPQFKAMSALQLIAPALGVVHANGEHAGSLTSRKRF